MSPTIQKLINNGLFDRLPPTFSTFFLEQIKDWNTLFPAEQSYFERLFLLIDEIPPIDLGTLFSTLWEVEKKMGVNPRTWPRKSFTLDQVDFLNRNAHYREWRQIITGIFAQLDPILEEDIARRGRSRFSIVITPAELPVAPEQLWLRLKGKRVRFTYPLDPEEHLLPLFSQGKPLPYDRWIIQSDHTLPENKLAINLSYEALSAYRERLSTEVQKVVEGEKLRGPRELGARLRQMKIHPSELQWTHDPVMAEFLRAVLLAGNGTLLLNNTFAEWATIQAIRRARPSMVMTSFGIRNKMKPFSSLLIYADQEKTNVIPTQMDVLGSYVDLEIFYQYIWQEYEKYVEYRNNTVHLFMATGMEETLLIAPRDFPIQGDTNPKDFCKAVQSWMNL